MEIVFNFTFTKRLTDLEQMYLADLFIECIEKEEAYWGGGTGETYLRGGLSFSAEKENHSTIEDLKTIVQQFSINHKDYIKKLTFEG